MTASRRSGGLESRFFLPDLARSFARRRSSTSGRCCWTIINLDVPRKATTLEQRGNRVHRIDGTAKYEVINLVLTGTLEHGLLSMLERKADLQDAVLGESGRRTRTTGGKGRNFFEQALESWSVDSE